MAGFRSNNNVRLINLADPVNSKDAVNKRWAEENLAMVPLYQANKVLTDAQIRALPTTSIVIVPSIDDVVIWPIFAVAHLSNWHVDYGNIHAQCSLEFALLPGGAVSNPLSEPSGSYVTNLLAGGGPDGTFATFGPVQRITPAPTTAVIADSGWYDSDVVGKDLIFRAVNSSGDFTGGHASTTLQIALEYRKFDITTGSFV